MKRQVKNWTVEALHKARPNLGFPEYQRQPNLWSDDKKSLLIDSILMNIDIPKLYFNRTSGEAFDVIDGQQRLWAIWEFLDDAYKYKPDHADAKASFYSELSKAQRELIRTFELQITQFEKADEEYLRQLFLRLQFGLLLNTGEKLHAETGEMKDFIFDRMVEHPFIKKLGVVGRRYVKETLCAQICANSFARKQKQPSFARTRYEDLLSFFRTYEHPIGGDAEFFRERTAGILRCLDDLNHAYGAHTKDLKNRSYALSVYLYFEELLSEEGFNAKEQKRFVEFSLLLWSSLRKEVSAGIDRKNRKLYELETLISSAPGERYQIERRHTKINEFYRYYCKEEEILSSPK